MWVYKFCMDLKKQEKPAVFTEGSLSIENSVTLQPEQPKHTNGRFFFS